MAKKTSPPAEPVGACMCREFAKGHKSVHNWGQPGCKNAEP